MFTVSAKRQSPYEEEGLMADAAFMIRLPCDLRLPELLLVVSHLDPMGLVQVSAKVAEVEMPVEENRQLKMCFNLEMCSCLCLPGTDLANCGTLVLVVVGEHAVLVNLSLLNRWLPVNIKKIRLFKTTCLKLTKSMNLIFVNLHD